MNEWNQSDKFKQICAPNLKLISKKKQTLSISFLGAQYIKIDFQ